MSSGASSQRPGAPRGVVGIDLGTSHTSLAVAENRADAEVVALPIEQWVSGRRRGELVLLPSVAYATLEGELPEQPAGSWVVGEYARIRSRETAGRGIDSAKSWLCHAGVDRLGPILPWGSSALADGEKLSPVEVSRRVLVQALGALERQRPEWQRDELSIVITVPASFDQTARKLTVMAAERAGLEVRLLEEPQAAFYEYLSRHRAELEALVDARGSVRVLVCDVGGGTTDLSLIDVTRREGQLYPRRSAVGRHLLLGGDNMDLSLARLCEQRLGSEPLDAARLGQLRTAARGAKEALLAPDAPASVSLRLLGQGSALFADSLAVELGREEVRALVLDGFFPLCPLDEQPEPRRSGLRALGLPFEREPAVTRHIAQFLLRHAEGTVPDALLLNGGVMRSPLVRERLLEQLEAWAPGRVALLSAHDPELSVCRGAVRYALALAGHGARIEGGAAQGYYVAIGEDEAGGRRALCVVPRGSREGERHVLGSRRFELLIGRPARFELYAHDAALHAPGAAVSLDSDYVPLPRLTTVPDPGAPDPDARVQVQLDGELSAVGTVELGCTLIEPGLEQPGASARRLSLAFELGPNAALRASTLPPASLPEPAVRTSKPPASIDAQRLAAAREALTRVFGKGRKDVTPREVKDLSRSLERQLGARKEWDLELSRKLADVLLEGSKARTRSEDHERVYWMLLGFCLRPGFGHPRDPERLNLAWPAFDAGLSHNKDGERGWQQFWIAWRRVAGGLTEAQQTHVRDLLDPALAPAELKLKRPKTLRLLAPDELLELSSHLERVAPRRRAELGGWLLERTWSNRDPRLWSNIGRIGAREPLYASAHYVLEGRLVERWVEQLLRERWSEVPTAAACAFGLCRVTGDEARDLSPRVRAEVARALERSGAPELWSRAVLEHVPMSVAEREERLGEDLPLGLRLLE